MNFLVESQKSKVKRQKSKVESQKSKVKRQKSKAYFLWAAIVNCAELKIFCQMIYAAAPNDAMGSR